jgi:hypothetical protein
MYRHASPSSSARRCTACGGAAVVDPDHGLRARLHERGVLQPVAALQVHDYLGSAVKDVPEKAPLDGVE